MLGEEGRQWPRWKGSLRKRRSAWLAESSAMNLLRTSTSATATLANEPPHSSPMLPSAGGGSAPLRRPHLPLAAKHRQHLLLKLGSADAGWQRRRPSAAPACQEEANRQSTKGAGVRVEAGRLLKKPTGEQTSRPMMAGAPVESKAHGMVRELRRLLAVLRSGGRSERWPAMAPRDLHRCLPEPFNSTTQQDAAELLRFLIDGLEAGVMQAVRPPVKETRR